jgi:hypothetical protein
MKHSWQQFTPCYCIIEHRTVRILNFVCLILELLMLYLLCVITFKTDCISICSCACGCPNKGIFQIISHTNFMGDAQYIRIWSQCKSHVLHPPNLYSFIQSLWGTAAMEEYVA